MDNPLYNDRLYKGLFFLLKAGKMTDENYNKALWIFKNFKETVDVMPKKYRGRAWEIIINYAFGEVEEIEKENPYIQMAVKSLIPLIKLRGKGGSQSGISNNPTGKSKSNINANVGANVGVNIGANVGATPYITETETINKNITETQIPTKDEILNYVHSLCKKIDVDSFITYYEASQWNDKNGLPINWKQKALQWANRYNDDAKKGTAIERKNQAIKDFFAEKRRQEAQNG